MRIDFKIHPTDLKERNLIEPFCAMLVRNIKSEILTNVNWKKMELREDYIRDASWIRWVKKPNQINMRNLVTNIVNNISYKSRKGSQYVIWIDSKKRLKDSRATLSAVARFLDRGNDKVLGTNFINKVFRRYRHKINDYWKAYVFNKLGRISVSEVVLIK